MLPNGIKTLARDFYENQGMCKPPVNLKIGDEAYVIETNLIDEETDFYAIIPCVVVDIQPSSFPGRWYYTMQAKGSKCDEALNVIPHKEGLMVYRYIENTSPCLFDIRQTIDLTDGEAE